MPDHGDAIDQTPAPEQSSTLTGALVSGELIEFLDTLGEAVSLLLRSLRFIVASPLTWKDAIPQISTIGVNSLSLVVVTVAFSGMVLSLYSSLLLVKWGVGSYVGGGIAVAIVREIAPVLTSVVVAARAGSAIAAEIGTMKVTEQIDALRSLSISPVQYLVSPRIIAGVLVFPMLTIFANVTGTLGGYIVAVANGVPAGSYLGSAARMVTAYDVSMGLVKAAIFGMVVALVCCQQGLRTRGGATGVGRSTTNAVVISIVLIYILNYFLAYLMFAAGGK